MARRAVVPPLPRQRPNLSDLAVNGGGLQAHARPPVPMPRPRPLPDVLGTGNTNFMPRPRPQPQMPAPPPGPRSTLAAFGQGPDVGARPDQKGGGLMSLENAQLQEARTNLNPAVNFAPGTTFDSIFRREQTGNARTREAQAKAGPLNYTQRTGPPRVGQMQDVPFAQKWDDINPPAAPAATPTPQAPAQVAAQPAKPGFTPSPTNPGIGLPGLPPAGDFAGALGEIGKALGIVPGNGSAAPAAPTPAAAPPETAQNSAPVSSGQDDAAIRKALETKLWQMMLGARIQGQPQPWTANDEGSTASQPPAFTSPMGAYR